MGSQGFAEVSSSSRISQSLTIRERPNSKKTDNIIASCGITLNKRFNIEGDTLDPALGEQVEREEKEKS